jgi:hypothetical protein
VKIITFIFYLLFLVILTSCGDKPIDKLASANESIKTTASEKPTVAQVHYAEGSVEAAVVDYVQGDEEKPQRMSVEVVKIVGDYAKAKINLLDVQADTATAYLKKVDGEWEVLDFGTGVNPMELGVPEEVWGVSPVQNNPNFTFKRDAAQKRVAP